MHRNRMMSAVTIGLAALASATTVISATAADAAPYVPAQTGLFATWPKAQSAAKFKLLRPTKTNHLSRNSPISVSRCEISKKKAKKRVVMVGFGATAAANLTISENNSGGPCSKLRPATRLAKLKIQGNSAVLVGDCNQPGLPKCSSKKIFLFLTWRHQGVYYQASSFGESRATLITFARGLARVK